MYGRGSGVLSSSIVTGAATAGSGASALPHTSGNMVATTLAITAITFGVGILVSQIVVRILRKKYVK